MSSNMKDDNIYWKRMAKHQKYMKKLEHFKYMEAYRHDHPWTWYFEHAMYGLRCTVCVWLVRTFGHKTKVHKDVVDVVKNNVTLDGTPNLQTGGTITSQVFTEDMELNLKVKDKKALQHALDLENAVKTTIPWDTQLVGVKDGETYLDKPIKPYHDVRA